MTLEEILKCQPGDVIALRYGIEDGDDPWLVEITRVKKEGRAAAVFFRVLDEKAAPPFVVHVDSFLSGSTWAQGATPVQGLQCANCDQSLKSTNIDYLCPTCRSAVVANVGIAPDF